jgi:hypothetical protein
VVQVEELADQLVDGVPGFHLDVHGQEECEKELEAGQWRGQLAFLPTMLSQC